MPPRRRRASPADATSVTRKAAFLQEPAKQQPQPLVIVDHKDVLNFCVLDVIHHVTGTCTTSPVMRAAG